MFGKQKNTPKAWWTNYHTAAFIITAVLTIGLGSLFFNTSTSYAAGNCVGEEIQGSATTPKMPDPAKCYLLNAATGQATATSNAPTGLATPGLAGGAGGSSTQGDDTTNSDQTCAIEKVGWILCPIIESMAKISDNMFDVLANNFLRTDTELFREDSGTKTAWEAARNIANIMFIIAFLIIIISQVTSLGISNYGIKKMLPRLVIAAIAVNISYYICQLVVDITNILGYEIQNALAQIADGIGPSVFGQVSNTSQFETGNAVTDFGILALITAGALASVAVWLVVGQAIAVILVVLITVLTIIIILLLRKALIVLLIVISPIAFVLYLLPNTEKYFSKWMKMFGQLLMVFPVVGLLFGAGQLASTIILVSGASVPPANAQDCDPDSAPTTVSDPQKVKYDGTCEGYVYIQGTKKNPNNAEVRLPDGEAVNWTLGLVAMGVAAAPLIAVYSVLKGALSAAGAIGGTINSMAAKGRGGATRWGKDKDDRLNKRMQTAAIRSDSKLGNAINRASFGSARRSAKRKAIDASLDRELGLASAEYTARAAQGDAGEGFRRQLAGGSSLINGSANAEAMGRAESNADMQLDKIRAGELEAAMIRTRNNSDENLRNTIRNGDMHDPEVAAAIQHLAQRQDFEGLEEALNKFAGAGPSLAVRTLSSSLGKNAPELFTGGQLGQMERGEFTPSYRSAIQQNLANGNITAEKAASLGPAMADHLSDLAAGNQQAMQSLVNSSHAALNDPILSAKIGRNRSQLENFSKGQNAAAGRPANPTNPGDTSGRASW